MGNLKIGSVMKNYVNSVSNEHGKKKIVPDGIEPMTFHTPVRSSITELQSVAN